MTRSALKYLQVFSISWASGFVYRLNFIMWRLRSFIQLLAVYFLWQAITVPHSNTFDYSQSQLLTYVILTSFMRSLVLASRSQDIQNDIGSGDLSNYLVKPVNYFKYWLTRDFADKILNFLCSFLEVSVIIILLKPPLQLPPTVLHGILFIAAAILALVLYFFCSLLISLSVFWWPEGNGWSQRFFILVVIEFLAGGLFPLDILPDTIYTILGKLPTAYLLNVPLQIYLGRQNSFEAIISIFIMVVYIALFYLICRYVFKQGLRVYGAYGR